MERQSPAATAAMAIGVAVIVGAVHLTGARIIRAVTFLYEKGYTDGVSARPRRHLRAVN